MDANSPDFLINALVDAGVWTQDQAISARAGLTGFKGDANALADKFKSFGSLTSYQIRKIRHGRIVDLTVGPFVIFEKIGEGGMGKVYKAVSKKIGRPVALKVVRSHLMSNKTVLRRYKREASAAAAMDHPNIVTLIDADEAGGRYFLAMEYVEGSDLSRMVKENGPLPYQEAAEYIRQSALGLQHAHERGLIHRDIKPSNILVSGERALPGSDGVALVKILDMGLVRSILEDEGFSRTELTRDGTVVGTPDYMAPEQAKNSSKVDAKADLYSLGATLFYLLRGQSPFPEGSPIDKLLRHQLDPPPDLRKLRPDLPVGLVNVINKLLKKKPEERYSNAAELAVAIQPYTPAADAGLTFAPAAADRGVSLDLPASQVPAGMHILDAEIVETKMPTAVTPVATLASPARPKPKPPVRKVPAKKIVRPSTLHNSDPISGSMPGPDAPAAKSGTTPTRPPTNRTVTDRTPPRNVYKRPTQNSNRRILGYVFAGAGAVILLTGTVMLFAGGKNKQNTLPTTPATNSKPDNPTPSAVGMNPPAPRGDAVLAKSDRVVADNAVAVLVVYPQQFWKRTDFEQAPRPQQTAWLKWLSTNYAFDTRLFDRVTVSLLPRQESFAIGEGSGITAGWIETLRKSFEVSDSNGWRSIYLLSHLGAPKDRSFGLLMGGEAIAIGSSRQDIQRFGLRYSQNKAPTGIEAGLLVSIPTAEDKAPPFLTFSAGKYWRLPETERRPLMDYGVSRLLAVVRLVGDDVEVDLTVFGESEKRIKDEFLSLGLATHLTEKYPALRPIQLAINTVTPEVSQNGSETSVKIVSKWPMAEFHTWLEPLLGSVPSKVALQ